jgi:hypothetical protein
LFCSLYEGKSDLTNGDSDFTFLNCLFNLFAVPFSASRRKTGLKFNPEKTMINSDIRQLPDNGFTELWLHYLWREGKLHNAYLQTEDGRSLSIIFPGWYNRSWGPDFSEARIVIDGIECFGDVEIHVSEASWQKHNHHQDSAYNRVILHVYFKKDGLPAVDQMGREVPALFMGSPTFEKVWYRNDIRRPVMMKEMPGACGLCLTVDRYPRLKDLIFQAAEQNLLDKSERMAEEMGGIEQADFENLLFRRIFRAAGYAAFSQSFEELGRFYPYSYTLSLYRSMHRQNRIEILGRWLGFLGFLDKIDPDMVHDSYRREWMAFQQFWSDIGGKQPVESLPAAQPSRPYNHPLRRIVGLYYHMERVQFQGLLKSWLGFLMDCRKVLAGKRGQLTAVLRLLDTMFPQPDWEPLGRLMTVTSAGKSSCMKRLIGKQRQLIILVNAIIPVFLIWARSHKDRELERTLFDLFLVLPAEAQNRKTRFLEQRLLSLHPDFKVRKNLSYHQGLIRLHDDSCKSYYEGCRNCSLVRLLQKTRIE